MENTKFLWLVTTDMNLTRDIEEIFTTKESAEEYARNEIQRCNWEVLNYESENNVSEWKVKSKYYSIFCVVVTPIPFNNF